MDRIDSNPKRPDRGEEMIVVSRPAADVHAHYRPLSCRSEPQRAGLEPAERARPEFPGPTSSATFVNLVCLRSRALALPANESGVPEASGLTSCTGRIEWLGEAISPPLRLRLTGSG